MRAVTIRLDEPEELIPAAQARYLDNVLKGARRETGSFTIRFQYDLVGTSHWEGGFFCLDVHGGECLLRPAGHGDVTGEPEEWERSKMRAERQSRFLSTGRPGRDFSVLLDSGWVELDGERLRDALALFQVADLMGS